MLWVGRSDAASPVQILSFQAGGIATFAGGTTSLSPQIAWTPIIGLGGLGLRGELGIARFKPAGTAVYSINYEALLQLGMMPNMKLELGGGAQSTTGGGGTGAALSAGLTFGLTGTVDRIYATYSRYTNGTGSNAIKLGLGLIF